VQKPNSYKSCFIVEISRLHTIRHTQLDTHIHMPPVDSSE